MEEKNAINVLLQVANLAQAKGIYRRIETATRKCFRISK